MKPSAATTACAGRVVRLAVDGDVDGLDGAVAVDRGDLGLGDDLDLRRRPHRLDRALVGAERVAPVHQGDRLRDRLEVQRPVERAVTAADDDDVLADVRLEARHEELEAAAQPAVAGGQRARAELADAGGDQHDLGADRRCRRRARRSTPSSSSARRRRRCARGGTSARRSTACVDQPLDQLAALDRREPGDVEDLLLGVHRGDLAAQLGQRVDDGDAHPAEAGVVGGEQAGRACADDEEVGLDGSAGRPRRDPSPLRARTQLERVLVSPQRYLVSMSDTSQPWSVCTTVTSARYCAYVGPRLAVLDLLDVLVEEQQRLHLLRRGLHDALARPPSPGAWSAGR